MDNAIKNALRIAKSSGRANYAVGGSPTTTRPGSVLNRPTGSIFNRPTTTTPAVTTPPPDASAVNFVTSVYRDMTGRVPDSGIINSLASDLISGNLFTGDIVQQVAATPEFANVYKTNPNAAANSLSQYLFGRTPTTHDQRYWSAQIKRGNTADKVISDMMTSQAGRYAQDVANIYRDYTGTIPTTQQLSQALSHYPRTSDYDAFIERVFPPTSTGGTQVAGSGFVPSAQTLANRLGSFAHTIYQGIDSAVRDALPGLIGQESGGTRDPWRAKAKTSSAAGLFQFTDGTWISQFAKLFGDQIGLSEKEKRDWQTNFNRRKITPLQRQVLNLRTDNSPEGMAVTMAMGGMFNQDNANKLKEKGLPVTPANLYSVHFSGGTRLAEAAARNPNAPISQGMTRQQLRANRAYQGKTLGQVMGMIESFFDPNAGKVARGQGLLEEYTTAVNNSPSLRPQAVAQDPQPSVNVPPPATGPTVVPEAAWGNQTNTPVTPSSPTTPAVTPPPPVTPGQPQSSLTPAEILAAQGAGSGAVGPVVAPPATGGGGLPGGVSPSVGPIPIYQPPMPTYTPPPLVLPSAIGGGYGGGGFSMVGGGGSFGGGYGGGGTGGFGVSFMKSGGAVKPNREIVGNALRIARRKGGEDPAVKHALRIAERRRYAEGGASLSGMVSSAGDALSSLVEKFGTTLSNLSDRAKEALMSAFSSESSGRAAFNKAMDDLGITDPNLRNIMAASVQAETGFNVRSEDSYAHTSNNRIRSLFSSTRRLSDARLNELKSDPQQFFNYIYGNKNGNRGGNDGYNYRGRGAIQLTGRDNYAKYGQLAGFGDALVKDPELMNNPVVSGRVSVAYMNDMRENGRGRTDAERIFRGINAFPEAMRAKQQAYQLIARTDDFAPTDAARENARRIAEQRAEEQRLALQRREEERQRLVEARRAQEEERRRLAAEERARREAANQERRRLVLEANAKRVAEALERERQAQAAREQAAMANTAPAPVPVPPSTAASDATVIPEAAWGNQTQPGLPPAGTVAVPGGGSGFVPGGGGLSGPADTMGAGGDYTGSGAGVHTTTPHVGTHHGGTHTSTPITHGGVHPVSHGTVHGGGHTAVPHATGSVSYLDSGAGGYQPGGSFTDYAGSHGFGHTTVGQHHGPYDAYGAAINKWEHSPVGGRDYDLYTFGNRGGVMKSDGGGIVQEALRIARASGGRSPAWTRKEGQNPEGGLNAKGRASAKAEGSNLKPPAPNPKTDKDAARRKSFCARMKGMKAKLTSSETANDPDSRINKSLRAWNCREYGGVIDNALRIAKGGEVWDKPRPKSLGEPEALSKKQKRSAKAAAKAAGRPWPNLVDNMRAAQRKK